MKKIFIDRMVPFLLLFVISVVTGLVEIRFIGFSVVATLIIRGTALISDWLLSKPYAKAKNRLVVSFGLRFPNSPLFASYLAYSFSLFIIFLTHPIRLLILYAFDMVTLESIIKSIIASILLVFVFAWVVDFLTKKVKAYFKKE